MRSPRLSRRLQLEAPVRNPDGAGGFVTTWTTLGTLWAELEPGTTRVAAQPGGTESRLPIRVVVRAAPLGAPRRPVAGQRFRDGTRLYAIASVTQADPLGRFLTCLAHEELAL